MNPGLVRVIVALMAAAACGQSLRQANSLSPCEQGRFTLLFDGTAESFRGNFTAYRKADTGFVPLGQDWKADPSDSSIRNEAVDYDIRSRLVYKDIDLRFDYRADAASGAFYRGALFADRFHRAAAEFCTNDLTSLAFLAPGALRGFFPPNSNEGFLFSTGKWNRVRILVAGDSVEHWLNGRKVLGYKLASAEWWAAYDLSAYAKDSLQEERGAVNRQLHRYSPLEGYFGFESGTRVHWHLRNLRVSFFNSLGAPAPDDSPYGCATDPVRPAMGPARLGLADAPVKSGVGRGPALSAGARRISADGSSRFP